MAETLHFSLPEDELHTAFAGLSEQYRGMETRKEGTVNIANSLWIDHTFALLDEYVNMIRKYYGPNLFQVDFINACEEIREQINTWVAGKTRDKIKNLLQKKGYDVSKIPSAQRMHQIRERFRVHD